MKKTFIFLFTLVFLFLPFYGCNKNDTIRINEVTHSVFYTPLYLAIEDGFFEEEGIKIELTNGGGADKSMAALLSNSADIALMGPETVIYVANQNKKDSPKVFAQLTQKDGSFLVSRNEEKNFSWNNLLDKEILAGRKGGVPAMTFEYLLYEKGMINETHYTLNYDVQFNLMTSAFIGGIADYCTVFEPTASDLEKNGTWHIVASVGEEAGEIPYTTFISLESFLTNNSNKVKSFVKALKKAMDYLYEEDEKNIAEIISKQFPSSSIESIETSIKNYKKIDAWKKTLISEQTSYDRLQNIMEYSGELSQRVSFDKIVNNSYVLDL